MQRSKELYDYTPKMDVQEVIGIASCDCVIEI